MTAIFLRGNIESLTRRLNATLDGVDMNNRKLFVTNVKLEEAQMQLEMLNESKSYFQDAIGKGPLKMSATTAKSEQILRKEIARIGNWKSAAAENRMIAQREMFSCHSNLINCEKR